MKTNYFFKHSFLGMITFLLACCWISCKDDDNKPVEVLDVSTNIIEMGGVVSDTIFDIQSNTSWIISAIPDWLKLEPTSGSGNARIKLSTLTTNEGVGRTAKLVIAYAGQEKNLTVIQGKFDRVAAVQFGTPYLEGEIFAGEETTAKLIIPYTNGLEAVLKNVGYRCTDHGFDLKIMPDIQLAAEEGKVEIPLSGKPAATSGKITFTLGGDVKALEGLTIETSISIRLEACWDFAQTTSYGIRPSYTVDTAGWNPVEVSTTLVSIGNMVDEKLFSPMVADSKGYFGGVKWAQNTDKMSPVSFIWMAVSVPDNRDFSLKSLEFFLRLNSSGPKKLSVQYYIDKNQVNWVQRISPDNEADVNDIDFTLYTFQEVMDITLPELEFASGKCENTDLIKLDFTTYSDFQHLKGGEQLVLRLVGYETEDMYNGIMAFTSKDIPAEYIGKNVILKGIVQ